MKLLSTITAFLLIVGSFYSCQKESDINNLTNSDSTLLKTYIVLPSNSDTGYKFNYFYDANKRLMRREVLSSYVQATGFSVYHNTDFFYNGSDSLPYKTILQGGNKADSYHSYVDTSLYFYTNGKLTWDSTIHCRPVSNGNTIIYMPYSYNSWRYTYNGTNLTALLDDRDIIRGQSKLVVDLFVTQTSPNILTIERHQNIPGNPIVSIQRFKITYDNRPNPLYKLNVPTPGYGLVYLLVPYRETFPNNVTEFEKIYDNAYSPSPWHDKIEYTYRADQFPVSAVHFGIDNGPYYLNTAFVYQ